jgi:uncharacterized protein
VYIPSAERQGKSERGDGSAGRIVSVTGSKAIVLLDDNRHKRDGMVSRPEMGTLLAIDTNAAIVLGLVSALSVPVPAQKEDDPEVWIAELGLVGEVPKDREGRAQNFSRGVASYPSLGDRVRVASREELLKAFSAPEDSSVRVGVIRQDTTIPAMVRTDEMLGKHFAILGTTGTGKSCTTALIFREILHKNPQAHIILLDPHNEYATSFGEMAEVIAPRNLALPYWLLTFEELIEVLVGKSDDRKTEIEVLQELIPLCKSKYSQKVTSNDRMALKRAVALVNRYTVDTPVPYRMSDLLGMIDDKMGMLENKRDLSPYRWLKTRIETISQDQRYAFMFGGFTVNDTMALVLGRVFRVPVDKRPITILELTGLPTEIVNVVVSVLCRMTFDFALWGEGHVPVTLVCEEAHRYVPSNPNTGFEPAKRAIAKIAKEGRKYGASLCIVTQRPAEIDPTILSQCNTVFALRMSNDRDQQIVQAAITDTGSGLLEFLPALGAREAIAFGDGMTLPVRIKFDELPKASLPRSSTARFSEKWNSHIGDEDFLHSVVERWRTSGNVHLASDEASIGAESERAPLEAAAQAAAHLSVAQQVPYAQPARQAGGYANRATAFAAAPPPSFNGSYAGPAGSDFTPQSFNAQAGGHAQQPARTLVQAPAAAFDPGQEAVQSAVVQDGQPGFVTPPPVQQPKAASLLRRPQAETPAPKGSGLLRRPGGLGGLLRRRDQ